MPPESDHRPDVPEEEFDQVVNRLRERLLIAPRDLAAMLDLAAILERKRDLPGAIDLCQRALRVEPHEIGALLALGRLWSELGDNDRARHWLERAMVVEPDCAAARDALDRLAGGEALTPVFIRTLFDQYAPRFDTELTEMLNYRAPALVAAALGRHAPRDGGLRILDLGCGTGLSGVALKPFAQRLDGIDLSPGMIGKARERQLYDSLQVAEVHDFLAGIDLEWDMIAAVDMLNYVGDLAPIFSAAAVRLALGGFLIGTLEKHETGGVALTAKRRYAQGRDHLDAAAAQAGLEPVEISEEVLRTEGGAPVAGLIFVLRKG